MKYRAVVFDLDGTLTDSAPGIIRSSEYALQKMQRPALAQDTLRKFLGPPLADSFMRYAQMTQEEAVAATYYYRERYHATGWQENAVYPGTRSLLKTLKDNGAYVAVATGKPRLQAQRILQYLQLDQYFDCIMGPELNEYHARKQDIILRALNGIAPEKTVMVGDRDADVEGANHCGMDSIAVLYGYGEAGEFAPHQPTHTVAAPADLYAALEIAPPAAKAFFLSMEGSDGCGKTTQLQLLEERLRACGYDVMVTREPGGSPVAEKIRQIVLGIENTGMEDMTEALLYAAARAQHVREVLRPALQQGKIVLCDRYVDSSIAYQGAGRQLGMDVVAQINAPAIDGLWPDATIYLDIDWGTAMRRRTQTTQADRIEIAESAFHARVAEGYRKLLAQYPQRIIRIDAAGDSASVLERVFAEVTQRLAQAGVA